MKKVFFVVGLGLLPLVMAIMLLYLGSLQSSTSSSEYWTVAPWFLILGIVPAYGVIFFIGFATRVVYENVSGSQGRKKKVAAVSFVLLVLIACGMAVVAWMN